MLYLVATPIGNLQDLSMRAIAVLNLVDCIYVEDTRVSAKLCQHYNISTQVRVLQQHNERIIVDKIIENLTNNQKIALISDAGVPLISDPGHILVKQCIDNNIPITVIPGACAVVTAVAGSGVAGQEFVFHGFLASKASKRQQQLAELKRYRQRLVFYEAPHRIVDCIADMATILGNRQCCIARELTKLHESWYRGTLAELQQQLSDNQIPQKGEFTVVVAGNDNATVFDDKADYVYQVLRAELNTNKAASLAAKISGKPKDYFIK